jgi:ribonuclease HII
MFGESQLRIIHEDQDRSSYELRIENDELRKTNLNSQHSTSLKNKGYRCVRVHFVVGADSKFLPVSLASMACKYLREVLVENINNYFLSFNPAIKPTAGYWQDGLRFIEDIKTHIPNLSFNENQLIRCR